MGSRYHDYALDSDFDWLKEADRTVTLSAYVLGFVSIMLQIYEWKAMLFVIQY